MTTTPTGATQGASALAGVPVPPGYTLVSSAAAGPPQNDDTANSGMAVPDGYTLVSAAGAPLPSRAEQIGGTIGRGLIEGAASIPETLQGIGRVGTWIDGALGIRDPAAFTDATNYPLGVKVDQELDREHAYQPISGLGRAVEGVTAAATGGLLTGGATGAVAGAISGVAGAGAGQLGASPTTQALVELGAGGAFLGGSAGRQALYDLAQRSALSAAPAVASSTDAAASAVRSSAALRAAQTAAPGVTPAQAAANATGSLQQGLQQYTGILKNAGLLHPDDAATVRQAVADAADPTKPNGGAGVVEGLGLPAQVAEPLSNGVADLNTLSSGALTGARTGPLSRLGNAAAQLGGPIASAGAGVIGALHGNGLEALTGAAGAVGLTAAHNPIGAIGARAGAIGDRLLGASALPGAVIPATAQRTLDAAGVSAGAQPLDQVAGAQAAVRAAQGQAASDAQDAATAALKARQTDQAWKANTAAQSAAEDAWSKAMAQRQRQNAAGAPDPLSAALWQQAEASAPNLQAVTASQVGGFNSSVAGRAMQAPQSEAANTASAAQLQADQARGTNLSEQAGAALERMLIAQHKAANPSVPITGAPALTASSPEQVFAATGGRYGSPAGTTPPMNGFSVTPEGSPAAPAGSPVVFMPPPAGPTPGSLQGPAGGMSGTPSFPLGPTPGLIQPATGGQALAQMIHRQQFGGPAPTPAEMGTAINDIAGHGLVHPLEADAAHTGQAITPGFANTIAHHVQAQRGLPSAWSATGSLDQASADVQGALGGDMPSNPVSPTPLMRAPVRDPIRWNAARADNMAHADDMAGLAPTQGEKQAILSIKGVKSAAEKQAILDRYRTAHPGTDTSRFTDRLMKGV